MAVRGQGDAVGLVADGRARPRLGVDRLHDLVLRRVHDRDSVVVGVGDEQRVARGVHRCGVKANRDRAHRRGRLGSVDNAQRAGRGGAAVAVRRDRGAVGVHGGLTGGSGPAALVADVQLAAGQHHLARRDPHGPRLTDRAGRGVDRNDAVLPVHRDVEGLAVGGVRGGAGEGLLAVDVGDGDRGAGTEGAVGVHGKAGEALCVRHPEHRAVRRVRRRLLPHGVVRQLLVDTDGRTGAPDQLVRRQVEDLQRDPAVGAGGGEEPPVGADGGGHELAVRRHEAVASWRDDLVRRDLKAVGVLRTDLVVLEDRGRPIGDAAACDDDGGRAGHRETESAGPEKSGTDDWDALSRYLHEVSPSYVLT